MEWSEKVLFDLLFYRVWEIYEHGRFRLVFASFSGVGGVGRVGLGITMFAYVVLLDVCGYTMHFSFRCVRCLSLLLAVCLEPWNLRLKRC